ncbi:MAG: PQQ-binding-like beta-propeller repeat protein [Planctomycetota bacterium]
MYDVAYLARGSLLLSAGWDGTLRTFESESGAPRAVFRLPAAALALEPLDDERVLVALKDGPLAAFALDDGRELWRAPGGAWPYTGAALAVAPGGAQAIVFDPGANELRTHATDDGRILARHAAPAETAAIAFAPAGTWLAVGGRATLWLHDPLSLAPQRALALEGQALDLAFAPDGSVLAVATQAGRVEVFELESGARLALLPASGTPLHTLAFDPSGTRLVTGADSGEVTLWDTRSWSRLLELDAHGPAEPEPAYHYVHDLAFHPAGTQLASASGDHTVRLWRALAPAELVGR